MIVRRVFTVTMVEELTKTPFKPGQWEGDAMAEVVQDGLGFPPNLTVTSVLLSEEVDP